MSKQTIIQKESPEIEAYKLGLLQQAKNLVDAPPVGGLPDITSQGMTTAQTDALAAAEQGLGAFQPYLDTGQATLAAGQTALTGAMGAPTQAQLDAYMNPYQQAIGDEITRAFDMQRSQAAQQAAAQGAFGGGRAAIQQAEIGRNEAAALAKAQADNFLQAQAAAQAELIKKSGCDGIVCSAQEAMMVRKRYKNLLIITPGIRLPGDSSNDQMRIMTPKQAFKNKVSGIVIGRSLTKGNIKNNTKKLTDHLNK